MANEIHYSTGRRKSSAARVFLQRGTGNIIVNDTPLDEYFGRETGRMIVRQPLVTINMPTDFDIKVTVEGGGTDEQLVQHDAQRVDVGARIDFDRAHLGLLGTHV